jgi:WD40 repeat protein
VLFLAASQELERKEAARRIQVEQEEKVILETARQRAMEREAVAVQRETVAVRSAEDAAQREGMARKNAKLVGLLTTGVAAIALSVAGWTGLQIRQAQNDLNVAEETTRQAEATKIQIENEKKRVDGELKKAVADRNKKEQDSKVANQNLEVAKREYTVARQQVQQAQQVLLAANGKVAVADQKVVVADKKVFESEQKLAAADQKITVADKKISESEKKVIDVNQKIAIAEQKVSESEKKIAAADEQVAVADKRVSESEKKVAAADEQVAVADKRVSESEQKVAAANEKIAVADKRVSESEQKAAAADQKVIVANEKVADADNKVTVANEKVADADKKVALAAHNLVVADEKVADANLRLAALGIQGDMINAQSEVFDGREIIGMLKSIKAGRKLQELAVSPKKSSRQVNAEISKATGQVLIRLMNFNRFQESNIIKIPNENKRSSSGFTSIEFSPDGQSFVAAAHNNHNAGTKIWSLNGSLLKTVKTNEKYYGDYKVNFSSDGKTINHYSDSTYLSPDGKIIASRGQQDTIELRNLDGSLLRTIKSSNKGEVNFSPDGKIIAITSSKYMDDNGRYILIELWTLDGLLLKTIKIDGSVYDTKFSPDGKTIAITSNTGIEGHIELWNLDGSLQNKIISKIGLINKLDFSPDGKIIALGGNNGTVELWNLNGSWKDKKPALITSKESNLGHVLSVKFSPDGKTVVASGDNGSSGHSIIKLWKLSSPHLTIESHKSSVGSIKFSPDGKTIVTGGTDGAAKLWDLNGSLLRTIKQGKNGYGGDITVRFTPNGKIIVVCRHDRITELRNLDGLLLKTIETIRSGEYFAKITINNNTETHYSANEMDLTKDGEIIASKDEGGTFELRNINGSLLKTIKSSNISPIWSMKFSPDGKIIAIGGANFNQGVELWNIDGTLLTTLVTEVKVVRSVEFSPDGKTIAIGGDNKKNVEIWSPNGQLLNKIKGTDSVQVVSFHPDGQIIAVGENIGNVNLSTLDGSMMKTIEASQNGNINSINFSPDGKTIVFGQSDGTFKLIPWSLKRLLPLACDWVSDYLRTNSDVTDEDRALCKIPRENRQLVTPE